MRRRTSPPGPASSTADAQAAGAPRVSSVGAGGVRGRCPPARPAAATAPVSQPHNMMTPMVTMSTTSWWVRPCILYTVRSPLAGCSSLELAAHVRAVQLRSHQQLLRSGCRSTPVPRRAGAARSPGDGRTEAFKNNLKKLFLCFFKASVIRRKGMLCRYGTFMALVRSGRHRPLRKTEGIQVSGSVLSRSLSAAPGPLRLQLCHRTLQARQPRLKLQPRRVRLRGLRRLRYSPIRYTGVCSQAGNTIDTMILARPHTA